MLPCEIEEYKKSFDDLTALSKLDGYIANALDVVIVDDIEKDLSNQPNQTSENYYYRQVGIYIVQHSSLLLALWDGKPPKSKYGRDAADVVDLALNHAFSQNTTDSYFYAAGNCAVAWINCRRKGDDFTKSATLCYLLPMSYCSIDTQNSENTQPAALGEKGEYKCRKTTELPSVTAEIIDRTVEYNDIDFNFDSVSKDHWLLEEDQINLTDDYPRRLHKHYLKSNTLSSEQKTGFLHAVTLFAILGAAIAFLFMLYDESYWNWLSLPCGVLVGILACCYWWQRTYKRQHHRKFLLWRALSETLRAQFYVSMCGVDYNICDSFTWMQKNDVVWIDRTLAALSLDKTLDKRADLEIVKNKWIGTGTENGNDGQHGYHATKKYSNGKSAKKHSRWSKGLLLCTAVLYVIIFVFGLLQLIGWTNWFDFAIAGQYARFFKFLSAC